MWNWKAHREAFVEILPGIFIPGLFGITAGLMYLSFLLTDGPWLFVGTLVAALVGFIVYTYVRTYRWARDR